MSTLDSTPRPSGRAPRRSPAPPAPATDRVELRSTEGVAIPLKLPSEATLARLAYQWSYIVRNRQRHTAASLEKLREQARAVLAELDVSENQLQELARRALVEVRIPFVSEARHWAVRILPWESLLSLATKAWRPDRHLVVIRHLDRGTPPAVAPRPEAGLLFVASAPGRLADRYDFTNEHLILKNAFPCPVARLDTPDRATLAARIATLRPGILHLSGMDTHEAEYLWPGSSPLENRADGFLLGDDAGGHEPVGPDDLPGLIAPDPTHRPALIAFNCYHSGARLAPLSVAAGAAHALGFQDSIDDTVAEQFFAAFYPAWRADAWTSPLRAFALARLSLGGAHPGRQLGDAVLWSERSLIPADGGASFHGWLHRSVPAEPPVRRPGRRAASARPAASSTHAVHVQIKPRSRLNYSLLHNNSDLFEEFKVLKTDAAQSATVDILIELHVGETTLPYRGTLRLDQALTDLSGSIRVPLVASMLRGRRESIHTSLYIEVSHAGVCLHRSTERVTLLPADEWTDAPAEWRWLPSFVLPRDPAILGVLGPAERYLRALADDAHLGFDGYQNLRADATDTEIVDRQVRALWAALLHDTPLAYINPPPVYTRDSQRLRTPAVVFAERRGTCLDLALFFAACLEYIGIYPAVFLIKGHAFPAYWRHPQGLAQLRDFGNASPTLGLTSDHTGTINSPAVRQTAWVFEGAQAYAEIRQAIADGDLVPLETVELTRRGAFAHARELGLKNLLTPWDFDALVDIQIAREGGVTPLPLFNEPTAR